MTNGKVIGVILVKSKSKKIACIKVVSEWPLCTVDFAWWSTQLKLTFRLS